jgi:hypothetical protein
MSYVPRRLVDINILQNMALNREPARLMNYEIPKSIKTNKIEKEIEKIKSGGYKKIGPGLLNGIIFVSICLLIYWILHYKYYKKKESMR